MRQRRRGEELLNAAREHVGGAPPDQRGDAWEPPPNGTAPRPKPEPEVQQADDGEPWEPPIPLNDLPPAAPFPVEVLPAWLAQYVQEVAWATNSPVDFAAMPLLAVASGVVGNSRRLAITRTHHQSACLFVAVVGRPGSGKSPALDLVRDPVDQMEHQRYLSWKQLDDVWKRTDSQEPRPVLQRGLLDDVTAEKMVALLAENQRGLLMIRDELAALVTGMNQYKDNGKGSDRQAFLKIWAGSRITIDRKSNQDGLPVTVRHPFLSIVGGIQPDVVEYLRAEAKPGHAPPDDGFLDRFLVGYPDHLPAVGEQWREVSQEASGQWSATVERLSSLGMVREPNGSLRPWLVQLTADGKAAWARFSEHHASELNAGDFPDHMRGVWSKLRGYCGRLALVLHCLRWATGAVDGDDVDGNSVDGAVLMIGYFKAHARRLKASLGADPKVELARTLFSWLASFGQDVVRRSDIWRGLRNNPAFPNPDSLDRPLRFLEQHHYVRRSGTKKEGPGRPPTSTYEINPCLKVRPLNPLNPLN